MGSWPVWSMSGPEKIVVGLAFVVVIGLLTWIWWGKA